MAPPVFSESSSGAVNSIGLPGRSSGGGWRAVLAASVTDHSRSLPLGFGRLLGG
jgi:hypothetical protein